MSRNYEPLHEVTMYQARCTNCGVIEDDYGDYSAWGDPDMPVEQVCEGGWFRRADAQLNTVDLLCEDCQKCEVCGSDTAYEADGHLVCEEHEDHHFTHDPEQTRAFINEVHRLAIVHATNEGKES